MHHKPALHHSRRAFSLVELLTVVALIGILATATIPAVGNMAAASRRTKSLSDLSTLFEGARQYAVAKNTYVWVAFSDTSTGRPLYASVIASRNGLAQGYGPDDSWTTQTIDVANNDKFSPVSRLMTVGDFKLCSDASFASTAAFKVRMGAQNYDLTRSVQFSPTGEAKIDSGVKGNIPFEISAREGSMARVVDRIIVNGPTGFVQFEQGQAL